MPHSIENPTTPPKPPRRLNPTYAWNYALRLQGASWVGLFLLIAFLIYIAANAILSEDFPDNNLFGTIALVLIFGIPLTRGLINIQRNMRILRRGDVVQGQVISVFLNNTGLRNYTPWVVSYRFLVHGKELKGDHVTTDNNIVDIIDEGQKVYVLYLRENPEQNMIWPFWEDAIIL